MTAAAALSTPDVSPAVARQAVEWLLELQASEQPRITRKAIAHWCRQHPDHQRAWQHIEQLNGQFHILANPRQARLAQRALTAPDLSRRNALKALSVLLMAGTSGYWAVESGTLSRWRADYRTATGEQRTVTLDDGTEIILNSGSALAVDYNPKQRRVALLEGEVFIRTAQTASSTDTNTHDSPASPFILDVPQGRMQPLGTRFAVRIFDHECRLAVYEGQVRLTPRQHSESHTLTAGQSSRFSVDGWSPVTPVDEQESAWIQGMIVVSRMPLGEFVAELNRYRPGMLRVDPDIAALTVSGTYPITRTDQVLEALASALPIKISTVTRYWVTLVPA